MDALASVIPYHDIDDDELTDDQIREKYKPVVIGPTWQKNEDGSWLLPKHTLGWQALGWLSKYLRSPADSTKPYRATPEQARFILWWYAVDDNGDFVYSGGTLQRLKGWGKDPTLAALSLLEAFGPCRFGGWDASGEAIAVPHPNPLVQIAAVNKDQTRNTTRMFPALITPELIAEHGLDVGKEVIYGNQGRSTIEAVTSSPRALEGGRATFVVKNETQHWIAGNNGHAMHDTIDGNATKMDGRALAITNAYLPGEDSVAQREREAWERTQDGRAEDVGTLWDSIEAPPHTPMTMRVLRVVIDMIRGDSHWLKIDRIMKSVANTAIAPERSRRMWLNQVVAGEDSLYSPGQLKACEVDSQLEAGEEIALGFDGSLRDDATALVACRIRDGLTVPLLVLEKPDGPSGEDWEVNRQLVDSAVHDAFRTFTVRAFYADVYGFEAYIDLWSEQYGRALGVRASPSSAIGKDMRGSIRELTMAHEALMSAVFEGTFRHNGDRILVRHMLNAKRRLNNYGVSFGKESRESKRKVDAYAAAMLAFTARRHFIDKGKVAKERTGRGYFL